MSRLGMHHGPLCLLQVHHDHHHKDLALKPALRNNATPALYESLQIEFKHDTMHEDASVLHCSRFHGYCLSVCALLVLWD